MSFLEEEAGWAQFHLRLTVMPGKQEERPLEAGGETLSLPETKQTERERDE